MPFLWGTDCNSKAILVSFPSIYISLELAWTFNTPYQTFTFLINSHYTSSPCLMTLIPLKENTVKENRDEGKEMLRKKAITRIYKKKYPVKALSHFPSRSRLSTKKSYNYILRERKRTPSLCCVCVQPCLSHILWQFSNMLTHS